MKKHKKIITDMIVNIISFGIPILILQFVILPHFASNIESEDYGLLLTLIALVSVISEMAIGTLANVRILENEKYKNIGSTGLFKSLFYILLVLSFIIVIFVSLVIYKTQVIDTIYLTIYYILLSVRIYYLVAFRIENKFYSVMINNLIVGAGYLVGLSLYKYTSIWQLVFILPVFMACLHLFLKTTLHKEKAMFNYSIIPLAKQNTSLMLSYAVGSGMSYLDRIFLYPILGGNSVSVYHVSTLMGKLYSLIGAPINMVILSYISKIDYINKKTRLYIIAFATFFGLIYAIASILISPLFINLLYPKYYEAALVYIPVATVGITIFNISTILRVISMKTTGHKTIFVIEIVYALSYILMALLLLNKWNLLGFAYANLIAATIRYFLYIIVNIFDLNIARYSQSRNKLI
jgi:O-antigen/teichoic acid export membrane protein